MHAHRAKKSPRPARRRGGVRTDGSPRIVEPGGANNRGSDTWAIVWSEGGRSKRFRTNARTETDAKGALQDFLNARAAAAYLVTVNDVLDMDLKRVEAKHKELKRRPALLQERKRMLKPVREHFGALAPEIIAAAYQTEYEDKRRREGVSDRTISLELAYLRAALKEAKRKGKIASIPDIVLPQPKARARRRVLTRKELARLMAAISDQSLTSLHLKGFVMLSLHTGQRGIHIRNLRWEHVDLDDGMIYFTLSNPNAAENKQTADMPITRGLLPVLQEMRRVARSPFVIEYQRQVSAKPRKMRKAEMSPPPIQDQPLGSLKTAFENLAERAGLVNFHIHDIRRSFATLGAIADIPIEQLAGLMNVDARTLRQHYAHGISDQTRKMIERIGGDE